MRGYTPPVLPEEEAIIWGDDGGHGLTPVQHKLFGLLRRSMDRKTGIAGERSRISYSGLYERMYQEAGQGFAGTGKDWGSTREQRMAFIRGQVRILEKTGLIKRSSRDKQLIITFSIFNRFRDAYFSKQNVSSGFAPRVSSGFAPLDHDNKNSDLPENNAGLNPISSGSDSGVCSTYPEVSRDTGGSKYSSSNLIDISNNHANKTLTDLQNQYWIAIQQTHVFSIQVLTRPDRQAEYQRMLALWESQGVDPGRLPDALKTILDDLTSRNSKAYSPMYFEQPVLRLISIRGDGFGMRVRLR